MLRPDKKLSNKSLHLMAERFSRTLTQMSSGVYQVSSSQCNSIISPANVKNYKELVFIVDITELI